MKASGTKMERQSPVHLPGKPGKTKTRVGRPVKLARGDTLVADEAYVRESILSPSAKVVAGYQPVMPSFQGQVREEQLLALIAYIESLQVPAERP